MARAFMIIDMLKDFCLPGGVLYVGDKAAEIIPYIDKELAKARDNGAHVIYLCDSHPPDDKEFERFPRHCVRETEGAEIIDALAPKPQDIVIPKTRFDAFIGTNLEEILRAREIDEVDVVGVCTSICVLETVSGLAQRDFKVNVHRRGVADLTEEDHEYALRKMEALYGVTIID